MPPVTLGAVPLIIVRRDSSEMGGLVVSVTEFEGRTIATASLGLIASAVYAISDDPEALRKIAGAFNEAADRVEAATSARMEKAS